LEGDRETYPIKFLLVHFASLDTMEYIQRCINSVFDLKNTNKWTIQISQCLYAQSSLFMENNVLHIAF
jgi:hypothetical protein